MREGKSAIRLKFISCLFTTVALPTVYRKKMRRHDRVRKQQLLEQTIAKRNRAKSSFQSKRKRNERRLGTFGFFIYFFSKSLAMNF